jgi:hypothetical protein
MHIREYKPDQFFRASIDAMDDFEDFKAYVAEYFCFKIPRRGEAVFTDLDEADEFLFQMYVETTPGLPPAVRRSLWLPASDSPSNRTS